MTDLDKKIIKVLRFYASADNYLFNEDGRGVVLPPVEAQAVVTKDLGLLAREILEEYYLKVLMKENDLLDDPKTKEGLNGT